MVCIESAEGSGAAVIKKTSPLSEKSRSWILVFLSTLLAITKVITSPRGVCMRWLLSAKTLEGKVRARKVMAKTRMIDLFIIFLLKTFPLKPNLSVPACFFCLDLLYLTNSNSDARVIPFRRCLMLRPALLLWHNTCWLDMTLAFRKSDQFLAQIYKLTTTGTTMTAKVINFEEKRKERDREKIVAKINEHYRQLREQGWIVCRPEKEK